MYQATVLDIMADLEFSERGNSRSPMSTTMHDPVSLEISSGLVGKCRNEREQAEDIDPLGPDQGHIVPGADYMITPTWYPAQGTLRIR